MSAARPFRFGLMASSAGSRTEWLDLARKAEDLGYATMLMPDHIPSGFSPLAALGAAAAATTEIRLGTLVVANDLRNPVMLAKEAATLDLLSDGRFELGLGAGWMNEDYSMTGVEHLSAGARIDRMIETVDILRGFWTGEPFDHSGEHYTTTGVKGAPKPVQDGGPTLVMGGGGKRMLSTAARLADVVGVNPNVHEGTIGAAAIASMSAEATDQKLEWVRAAAGDRFDDIEISILKFVAMVTDDREGTAAAVGNGMGMDADTVLGSPHTLVGSVDQIVEELQAQRERWQGSYVTVQADAIDAFAPVVAQLAGT